MREHSTRPSVHTTFRILLSTQPTEQPQTALLPKRSPSTSEAGRRWVWITGTELTLGVRAQGWENPLEATGNELGDSGQSGQEQSYWRSGHVCFMTQRMGVCFQERRARGGLEEAAIRREERSWQKDMVIGLLLRSKVVMCKCFSNVYPRPRLELAYAYPLA